MIKKLFALTSVTALTGLMSALAAGGCATTVYGVLPDGGELDAATVKDGGTGRDGSTKDASTKDASTKDNPIEEDASSGVESRRDAHRISATHR